MVGGGLGRHRQARLLGRSNHGHRPGRRQMLEVHPRPGEPRQGDVAHDHQLFRLGRLAPQAEPARPLAFVHGSAGGELVHLAVLGQHHPAASGEMVEAGRVLEGPPHHLGVLHAGAVIGEDPHSEPHHLGHGRQVAAPAANRDSGRGVHVAASCGAEVLHLAHHRRAVDGRIGVGHGHHGGEPAQGGAPGAGLDGLGVLPAGLAEMDVQIDEARRNHAPGGVERAVAVQPRGVDRDHPAVADQHVGAAAAAGVHHRPSPDGDGAMRGHCGQPGAHAAPASRPHRADAVHGSDGRTLMPPSPSLPRPGPCPSRAAGTGPPCGPPRRWRPARLSPHWAGRPRPRRSPRHGSWAPGA